MNVDDGNKLVFRGLESGGDIFTRFALDLGMKDDFVITEVFGLEPDLLMFVPRPVKAIFLLFPPLGEQFKAQRNAISANNPQVWYLTQIEELPGIQVEAKAGWFFNARRSCPSIALLIEFLVSLKFNLDSAIVKPSL